MDSQDVAYQSQRCMKAALAVALTLCVAVPGTGAFAPETAFAGDSSNSSASSGSAAESDASDESEETVVGAGSEVAGKSENSSSAKGSAAASSQDADEHVVGTSSATAISSGSIDIVPPPLLLKVGGPGFSSSEFITVDKNGKPIGPAASKLADAEKAALENGNADASRTVVSASPMPVLPNPTTEEFIDSICEQAREIGQKRGLYASVMIAQAILESGSGSSGLSKPPYNNLFGIKGSYKGRSAYMATQEDDGSGNCYDIMASFRSYPSVRESLEDYADLLTVSMGSFYAPAWKANAPTYVDACNYLQGHYATSTTYSSSLQGIIIAYNLVQYDHPATKKGASEASVDKAKAQLAAMARKAKTDADAKEPSKEKTETAESSVQPAAEGRSPEMEAIEAAAPALQVVSFGAAPLAVLLISLLKGGFGAGVSAGAGQLALSSRVAARLTRFVGLLGK